MFNLEKLANLNYHVALEKLAQNASNLGVILEIGVCTGNGHLALRRGGGSDKDLLGIDDFSMYGSSYPLVVARFEAEFQERPKIFAMTSREAARFWNLPISLLFVDGDHNYDSALFDLTMFSSFVIDGGFVVVHDSERGDVSRAIEEWKASVEIIDFAESELPTEPNCWYAKVAKNDS